MVKNILYTLVVFIFVSLGIRLMDTQLINGESFERLADNNRMYTITKPQERGVLLDRYSDPLVFNKPVYYKLDSSESLYSERTKIEQVEALIVMSSDSDLIRIEHEREYRYPNSTSHLLGYIGSVSVDDLLADSSLHISDKVGKFGLESQYEDLLRGSKGFEKYEINALGEKQHFVQDEVGIPGQNVLTTIDPYLSEVAYNAMGDNIGAVVIIDAETSEVLTLMSTPTFDSSVLSESYLDQDKERERILAIRDFFSHPQKLFFNRAVSGAYPPGSVFKLMTALAGLEEEKIDENTVVRDEGVLKVGKYSYANWYYTQYGKVEGDISLLKSIARSNDIYFYKVAEWVGPDKIKEMAQAFGLGEKTGIQLQAETKGLIPDPEWKQQVIGERWFLGNTYHFGIGQGDLLVSPIQIAQLVQGIANKGEICSPTLINAKFEEAFGISKTKCRGIGVLEKNIDLVLEGMLDACSANGTGFQFFNHNSMVINQDISASDNIKNGAVACKTGTSEFGGADNRGYRKTHGWFASIIGTKELIAQELEDYTPATQSAQIEESDIDLEDEMKTEIKLSLYKEKWINNVSETGFPDKIIIIALVESDESNPYKEGSKDAGPVVKAIFDWMFD